jgi:hypothetical protein
VRINKTYADISIKVTILKRKRKYIWGFMTFLERRENWQVQILCFELERWVVDKIAQYLRATKVMLWGRTC